MFHDDCAFAEGVAVSIQLLPPELLQQIRLHCRQHASATRRLDTTTCTRTRTLVRTQHGCSTTTTMMQSAVPRSLPCFCRGAVSIQLLTPKLLGFCSMWESTSATRRLDTNHSYSYARTSDTAGCGTTETGGCSTTTSQSAMFHDCCAALHLFSYYCLSCHTL